jgi:hypothetical protein
VQLRWPRLEDVKAAWREFGTDLSSLGLPAPRHSSSCATIPTVRRSLDRKNRIG